MHLSTAMNLLNIPKNARPSLAKIGTRFTREVRFNKLKRTLRKGPSPVWQRTMKEARDRLIRAREYEWGAEEVTSLDGSPCERVKPFKPQLDKRMHETKESRAARLKKKRQKLVNAKRKKKRAEEDAKRVRRNKTERDRLRKKRADAKKKAKKTAA